MTSHPSPGASRPGAIYPLGIVFRARQPVDVMAAASNQVIPAAGLIVIAANPAAASHFHSVGCASLTRSNGLRTAFERFPAARAVRTALQLTRRAERNSFSRDARFQFLAESVRCFRECLVFSLLTLPLLHGEQQTMGADEACSKNQTMRFTA